MLCPQAHKTSPEATRSSCYQDDLILHPRRIVGGSDVDWRGLTDGLDHALRFVASHGNRRGLIEDVEATMGRRRAEVRYINDISSGFQQFGGLGE